MCSVYKGKRNNKRKELKDLEGVQFRIVSFAKGREKRRSILGRRLCRKEGTENRKKFSEKKQTFVEHT